MLYEVITIPFSDEELIQPVRLVIDKIRPSLAFRITSYNVCYTKLLRIDFSMGNPDGDTPEHIRQKLIESAQKTKTHGYSVSKGIPKLRQAICDWYKRRFDVDLDADTEAVATMGSKEGYAHLAYAITNPGDVVVVPDRNNFV